MGTSAATFLTTNNEYVSASTLSNGVIFKRDIEDGTAWEFANVYRTLSTPLPGYLETLPNGTENSSDYWYRNEFNP